MRSIILSSLICLSVACGKSEEEPGNGGSQKGYATGKVVTAKGEAIAGAKVVANNSLIGNTNPSGVTAANGTYKIQLPTVGTYHTSATITKTYNGKTYTLDLRPDSYDEYSNEGAVRNFTWALTGKRGSDMEGYYGSSIGINTDITSMIEDFSLLEFTLTPKGALIDGSEGSMLTKKCTAPNTIDYGYLRDIPLGRYEITAIYKGPNGNRPVKLKNMYGEQKPFAANLILDFEPETLYGDNVAAIMCLEQ
ncbi:carboxypeptidase-like regulatory domain-containing protein [Chitinophaga sedimenti]|uniref:carboxypeptidase-like regulatory domain-containing protein n=1 Tax=Chitinophaga sedimenti TaxID=2033606 RepID=UPI002004A057|nr:carboxypeptidase-like regulatory domain-containing protein [Chitinophaga sedimenti]MCK7555635.1 carboxypeptidase-like regulatory domain-containing protein [Chitinophaga sedimenti]